MIDDYDDFDLEELRQLRHARRDFILHVRGNV